MILFVIYFCFPGGTQHAFSLARELVGTKSLRTKFIEIQLGLVYLEFARSRHEYVDYLKEKLNGSFSSLAPAYWLYSLGGDF